MDSPNALVLTSNSLKNHKVFVFDFDGTICDSFETALRIINNESEVFHYRKIQPSEYAEMRNLTAQEILKSVGISTLKLPFVVRKVRKEINKEIDSLHPFQGIKEALLHLKSKGYAMGILTSNSEENVLQFVKKNGLELFDFIYSGSSIFGKDKVISKLLKDLEISPSNAVYIGDEIRDVEAAKAVGIPIIAVSWGFNSRSALEVHRPNYLIDSAFDLQKF